MGFTLIPVSQMNAPSKSHCALTILMNSRVALECPETFGLFAFPSLKEKLRQLCFWRPENKQTKTLVPPGPSCWDTVER